MSHLFPENLKLRRYKSENRLLNLKLQWHITERCNLRCVHCYQETHSGEELEFKELLGVIEQFKDLLNLMHARGHITITGGEPFIRQDFMDILEAVSASNISFAILTNGSFIDANTARRLRNLMPAFVQVSIEGSKSTHDSIRGVGNFDRTVRAVKHLVHEHIRTFISFTAHRENFREFSEVARLGRELQVTRVWADRLIPQGRGAAKIMLTPKETCEFFEIMNKERKNAKGGFFRKTEISMHRALQFLVAGGKPYHCAAGKTLITVQPNGDLFPCRRMPIRVGNLMKTPLVELYFGSELFRALRSRISEECRECFYSALCRGGLRCLSYATTSDPFRADPGCWLASTGVHQEMQNHDYR